MGQVDPELAEAGVVRPPVEGLSQGPRRERRAGDAFGSASIGAVAVAASDPNVVWVGTGSACPRGNVSPGDGVYKSTDAGDSWRHMGLDEAGQIGRVIVHPTDPDIVYVAVLGNIFGPSRRARRLSNDRRRASAGPRCSLFRTRPARWISPWMPSNPRVLYAAIWQAQRTPWNMISGGPDSGLYKTVDGGNTWLKLSKGLPEGDLGQDRRGGFAGVSQDGSGRWWSTTRAVSTAPTTAAPSSVG